MCSLSTIDPPSDSTFARTGQIGSASRWHRVGKAGTLALAAAFLPACNSQATLNEEWGYELSASIDEPLTLLDYYPAHNVPGVPREVQPYFLFNRPVRSTEELELFMLGTTGYPIDFTLVYDFDRTGVAFVPTGNLYVGDELPSFEMDLGLSSGEALMDTSRFSAAVPPGLIFNMSVGLSCEQFGGSYAQAKLLQAYFVPGEYPLWMMVAEGVTASTKFPVTTNLYIGPAYIRSNGHYRVYRSTGFTTVFPNVTIQADGSFATTLPSEFLHLDTPDRVIPTWLVQIEMKGTFDLTSTPAKISDLHIEGILPTRSLLLLSDASEDYAKAVSGITLDVDLNGNGTNDSATFEVKSAPEAVSPDEFDE